MLDLRPVGYVVGLLVAVLGLAMILPMLVDLAEGRGHWRVFFEAGLITALAGGMISKACANGVREGLTIQQTFLLTTGVWLLLPLFGALPFMLGDTASSFTDAFFEAMSGLTTTGSTVLSGLEDLPKGLLLWRGILQWLGGVGIIVVAMVFLPELKVGGMQIGLRLFQHLPLFAGTERACARHARAACNAAFPTLCGAGIGGDRTGAGAFVVRRSD